MSAEHGRVGYVLKMYPRLSETFVVNEIRALEHLGADLEIFSLRPPADGRFHEALAQVRGTVTYLDLSGKAGDLWQALAACRLADPERFAASTADLFAAAAADGYQALLLAGLVRERGITHLHAHFGSVSAAVARLAARLAGIEYSVTLHAKDIFHDDVDREQLALRLRDAAAVVTVSDYNEHYLRERYPAATARLVRIYNGIELDAYPPSRPDVRPRVVAGVGRLVEKKGFDDLVRAIALLRDRGAPAHLDLVGAGEREPALREQVAGLGLEELVTFHGPLTQAETREVVRAAAVLAAPCVVGADGNRDGLPTAILESLALGTPVVATPVTGIPEAVIDEETGLLVPEHDPVALADALARLLDDPGLRCRLAEAGRHRVEQAFDLQVNAKLVHDVIGAGAGAGR
ncbi:MAG: glycosyltransferase family 4 protein [Nocardioidaceae bacterium]|nr:glycosyltransferase family 4 protein [Nocardioidaceae bacterium]